jgi:hypothetical protein
MLAMLVESTRQFKEIRCLARRHKYKRRIGGAFLPPLSHNQLLPTPSSPTTKSSVAAAQFLVHLANEPAT